MWAAACNPNPEVLSILIRAGAHVDAQDKAGCTALMYAVRNAGNEKCVSVLLVASADSEN